MSLQSEHLEVPSSPTSWFNATSSSTEFPQGLNSTEPYPDQSQPSWFTQDCLIVIQISTMALGAIFSAGVSTFFLSVFLISPQTREKARFILLACVTTSQTCYFLMQATVSSLHLSQHHISFFSCAIVWLLSNTAGGAELYSLAAMSIDRYLAVCRPLLYDGLCSEKNLGRGVLVIFLASCLLPCFTFLLQTGFAGRTVTFGSQGKCTMEFLEIHAFLSSWRLALFSFQFLACFLIITTSYGLVVKEAMHAGITSPLNQRARRTISFHMVQLGLYLIPVVIFVLYSSLPIPASLLPELTTANNCIFMVAQFINPLVYGFRSSELKAFLPSLHWRSSRIEVQT
ncbi:olfactory receptor 4K13-like [Polyodon spathula]|uniref:olfactory receptor 4K13-like n=1 Tax=Polyodon spathula TaxID=7913 RepID=UPI001B7E53E0|nr:olfactory receptor 4K13-like [Polyodon spathula]